MTTNTAIDPATNGMLMRYARFALLTIVAIIAMLAVPTGAFALPVLGMQITHRAAEVPPYPAVPVGHDDRLFFYDIAFTNVGDTTTVGDQLKCASNQWIGDPTPTLSYQWLRNGVSLGAGDGAQTDTYDVQPGDAGTALQCIVTGTSTINGGTAAAAATAPVQVAPASNGEVPHPTNPESGYSSSPEVDVPYYDSPNVPAGIEMTCSPPPSWAGEPDYDYRWLRNGEPIVGATTSQYTVQAADAGTLIQCEITGTNAAGAARGISSTVMTDGGATTLTYENAPTNGGVPPRVAFPQTTVSISLPPGVTIDRKNPHALTGGGWTCDADTLVCTTTNRPESPTAFPSLHLTVNLSAEAPDDLTLRASISGGGSAGAVTANETFTLDPIRPFGANGFVTSVVDVNGDDMTQAGGHPYSATTSFDINRYVNAKGELSNIEDPKTIALELPPGFIGNPRSAPACASDLVALRACPAETQVGVATTDVIAGGPTKSGVYNVRARKGAPAEFAFVASSVGEVHLFAEVRSDGDYGLTLVTPYSTQARLVSASFTFWGVPADPAHDGERCTPLFATCIGGAVSTAPQKPFLTNPTECSSKPPVTTLKMDSWQHPGKFVSYDAASPLVTGCDHLVFDPFIAVTPETTQADAPSGYKVHLGVTQTDDPSTLGTPPLKDATVTLPKGVSLSPGTADGLAGCTDDQLKLKSTDAADCPKASKIGTVHIATPVLPEEETDYLPDGADGTHYQLSGSIFLRKPDDGAKRETLYSIFLDIEDEQTGIVVKLRGTVVPNAETGQLTARFQDNPRLPFTDFLLEFKGGDRAPLTNPMACGPAETTSTLSSWGGPVANPTSTFTVDWDGNGGACPATLPFAPSFAAGTVDPLAGAFSPFTMTVKRDDRQQIMSGIDVDMPSGLLGMIGSVPLCNEGNAAAGTCGDESRIGSTTVSAGAGARPFSLPGKVFVAGPYKGQPFSLSIVVRAIAGPFDLGTVVVRAPIMVDAANAKLRVPADALPTILEGVPLRLRMINILLDRPQFIFNATNCSPQQVGAKLSSTLGTVASVAAPYQASGCANLPFRPVFKARSDGRLKFKKGAALKVNITQRPGEAAIKSVAVTLPKQLPSRLIPTINHACVKSVFENDPAKCPSDSYIGTSTARTPVFPDPLSGPVYVVAPPNDVPQIVVILHGQGIAKGIDLKLYGDIIIDSGGGRSKSTFHMVPDVPISSFALDLPAGPHSILDAPSTDVCQGPLTLGVNIVAQNGKRQDSNEIVAVDHCPKVPAPKVLNARATKRGIAIKTHVPSLGRLVVSGSGLVPVARTPVRNGTIVANAPFTTSTRRVLRRRSVKLKVKVWFQPSNAAKPSTKTVTVRVRQRRAK